MVHSNYNRYNCLGMGSVYCTIHNPHGPKVRRANYQSDSLCGCDSLGLSFDNDFWWQTVKKGGNEWKEHRPWNVWMTSLIYLSICCCLVVKPIKRQLTSSVVLKPLKIITMNQIHYAVCGPFFVNFLSSLSLWITCI